MGQERPRVAGLGLSAIWLLVVSFENGRADLSVWIGLFPGSANHRLDADGLARQLRSLGAGAALIRQGIPGLQPEMKEVLRRYGTRVAGHRRLAVFDLSWEDLGEQPKQKR